MVQTAVAGTQVRQQELTRDEPLYDAVIIGGGINGTAAALELSRAGYSVLLCEKGDFAGGASGRSSRMLHCGLRYFETPNPVRDFALHPRRFVSALAMARAAMEARADLAQDVRVSTRPITLCFPVWPDSPVRRWHLSAGLRLLQALHTKGPSLDARILGAAEARRHPITQDLRDLDRLQAMAAFREYLFVHPERLCLDAALEAESHGAAMELFTTARIGDRQPDGTWRVALETPQGQRHVRARTVINMAGTWMESAGNIPGRLVRGTKGAHIVVRLPERYRDHGIATMHRGGHPFYCLPLGDEFFYFGPTETPFEGDATDVAADQEDIDFLLGEANHLLPGLKLTRADVHQTWAGVRPLTWDPQRPMGARERILHDLESRGMPNVFAMTAGPVMSHRSAGREILDKVQGRLGSRKPVNAQSPVRHSAFGADSILPGRGGVSRQVLLDAVTREHARDLYGVLVQRTGLVWQGLLSREDAAAVADVIAGPLGWSDEDKAREVDAFLALQARRFAPPTATPTATASRQ